MRLQSKIASKRDQLDPIKLDASKLTDKDIKWWHSYRSLIDYATKQLKSVPPFAQSFFIDEKEREIGGNHIGTLSQIMNDLFVF